MGTEAWVKRAGERRQLLEELVRRVHQREDELQEAEQPRFRFGLLLVLLDRLRGTRLDTPFTVLVWKNFATAKVFFDREITPRITEFSRAKEETNALLAEFFSRLFESEKIHFQSALSKLEERDPQRILQAPSAMAEVEL